MEYLFWALAGWCGTPWRRWPPPPPPDPWWWIVKIVAIVGGIVGGILAERFIGEAERGPMRFVATVIGAAIIGRVAAEVVSEFGGNRGSGPIGGANVDVGR
ncbi:MAG TPA: hypothetical protein VER32_03515 [Pyrinomonadaceae bacterium]|nr:hypothetical protein [Pyrinomonadaceae bacterium]